ncbi:DUF4913 domain-containing protein [Streptomyces sp. NPDC001739]
MPEASAPGDGEAPDPVRVPAPELSDLSASVRRLIDQAEAQARALDHLAAEPPSPLPPLPSGLQPPGAAEPYFILTMEGEAYESELDALSDWVDDFLLPVYGREITTSQPWCYQWQEHDEAVARLHVLWLAYQQHLDPESGLAGMAVWTRDFLDHSLAQIRAANGPFAACTTDPRRPAHRVLPGPAAARRQDDYEQAA